MKKAMFLMFMLAVFLANVFAGNEPTYGVANVDGNASEWNLTNDFFADMYRAAKPDKPVESKLYLRYDCQTKTLYALVLVVPDVQALVLPDDAFIKLGNSTKLVDGNYGDDGVVPDFAWVGLSQSGQVATGWEASVHLEPGYYPDLNVHIQVIHDGQQTSAVKDRAIPLLIDCPPPTGEFKVGIKDDIFLGQKTLAWTGFKTGNQDGGCPGTYQAKGKVSIDTTAGQSVLNYSVSGLVVVTYECDGQYPPMAFSVVKDSLFAKVKGIWQLLGQKSFAGMTLACGQTWTGNFAYNFTYQPGMTKLKKVDVAYYGEGQSVRFEEEYNLPAPVMQNGCILVYHRWDGQPEKFLGQVCYTDQLPKVFNVDSTVTYSEPGDYSFKNYFRTSDGQSGEATHSFLIKECPPEKELELFKVWLYNGQEGVPPDVLENFRVVATSDIDKLVYAKIGGVLAWRDTQGNLRNKLKYILASSINVVEENPPFGWVNTGGLGQITPLNSKHYVYNSKEFTECDPDDFNVMIIVQKDGQPVAGVTMNVYIPVILGGDGDHLLTFNSDGSVTAKYVGKGNGDYVTGQCHSFDYWYYRWGGKGNLLENSLLCWDNKTLPTRPVVFELFAPQGQVFAINGQPKYTRSIRFDLKTPGMDAEGHVNIIPNFPEWYTDWVFELVGAAQFAANPITFAGAPERLVFEQGTPAFPGEDWNNAVDLDHDGWDGTVTAKGPANNPAGPAWATFSFADGKPRGITGIYMQTAGPGLSNERQAAKFDIYGSLDGVNYTRLLRQTREWGGALRNFNVAPMNVRYVKLVLNTPQYTSGNWRQLVEFGVVFGQVPSYARTTGEDELEIAAAPAEFQLEQNYPNPFNPVTSLRYQLSQDVHVTLAIFDISGQQVARLVDGNQAAGWHNVRWDAAGMPSGVYFARIVAGEFSDVKRMMLLK